jgi:hypothetical protein
LNSNDKHREHRERHKFCTQDGDRDRGQCGPRHLLRLPDHAGADAALRLGPGLPALAALVNGAVFIVFAVMYLLMRYRIVSFGHRD